MKLITKAEQLLEDICDMAKIDIEQVKSRVRKTELLRVRQIYAYIGNDYYGFSLCALGKAINRDHTTMVNTKQQFLDLVEEETVLQNYFSMAKECLDFSENDSKSYNNVKRTLDFISVENAKLKSDNAILQERNSLLTKKNAILERDIKIYKSKTV